MPLVPITMLYYRNRMISVFETFHGILVAIILQYLCFGHSFRK